MGIQVKGPRNQKPTTSHLRNLPNSDAQEGESEDQNTFHKPPTESAKTGKKNNQKPIGARPNKRKIIILATSPRRFRCDPKN